MSDGFASDVSLGHYRVVAKIGQGGMGELYRAHDGRLDRDVAIKTLPAGFIKHEEQLDRFKREAKATSALNHPNILTVYDIGEHEGIVDLQGRPTPISMPESEVDTAVVSPDGHRAATVDRAAIDIVDLDRGTKTPLAPELASAQSDPVWSPDGRSVTFASNHEGNWNIYSKAASGVGAVTPLLTLPLDQDPQSYAPDGTLLIANADPKNGTELWMISPGGEPKVWLSNGFNNLGPRFSPDGRLVAYSSNISGRFEVYVQSRDNPADRIQISAAGGKRPVWSRDGKQLFFRQGNAVMETSIGSAGLSATTPVTVFDGGWTLPQWYPFDVMPDGHRFMMIRQPSEAVQTQIDVVLNWFPSLKESLREGG